MHRSSQTDRYQPPKTIAADIYYRLCIAVEKQASEKIRALEHEITTSCARRRGIDHRAFCEAEILVAKARELLRKESE
jgi:hypothetical protein